MDHTFTGELFRWKGDAAWTFVQVPQDLAPPVTEGWGRTPVLATVDGISWDTSVWRGRDGRTLLAVPKKIRKGKGHGDQVTVSVQWPRP